MVRSGLTETAEIPAPTRFSAFRRLIFLAAVVLSVSTMGLIVTAVGDLRQQTLEIRRHVALRDAARDLLENLSDQEITLRAFIGSRDLQYSSHFASLRDRRESLAAAFLAANQGFETGYDAGGIVRETEAIAAQFQRTYMLAIQVAYDSSRMFLAAANVRTASESVRQKLHGFNTAVLSQEQAMQAELRDRLKLYGMVTFVVIGFGLVVAVTQWWVFSGELKARRITSAQVSRQNRQLALMSEFSEALQSAHNREEVYDLIARYSGDMFKGFPGSLYVFSNSRDQLRLAACWGRPHDWRITVHPDDCWALRRGRTHVVAEGQRRMLCDHHPADQDYVCLPIVAKGTMVGLLTILPEQGCFWTAERQPLALALVDQLSLALTNLDLRERLETMALKDALTGLYNRRYLEDISGREFARCQREQNALAILMCDIDHFKKFNDTYGHGLGDEVLRQAARHIVAAVRPNDVVCRYGGEEVMVLLPDCDLEQAQVIAERIRHAMETMDLRWGTEVLPPVTLSAGVAVYPRHGSNLAEISEAADQALYRAKQAGRNRVCTAETVSYPRSPAMVSETAVV